MAFKDRLKEIIDSRMLSQSDVATKMGCHHTLISQYICGSREPGLKNLIKLAEVLRVTTDYLCGRETQDDDVIWRRMKKLPERDFKIVERVVNAMYEEIP